MHGHSSFHSWCGWPKLKRLPSATSEDTWLFSDAKLTLNKAQAECLGRRCNFEPAKGFVCSCLKLGLRTVWKGFWKCLLFLTAWNFEVSLEMGREKGTTKQSKLAVTAVMKTCDLHCRQASPKSSWITCHALLHLSINQFFSLVSLISSVSLVWRRGRAHMQMLIFVFQPALN